ncbi:MAG: 4Fe-4S binding protein [Thermodesulfobacteriota bacterium]
MEHTTIMPVTTGRRNVVNRGDTSLLVHSGRVQVAHLHGEMESPAREHGMEEHPSHNHKGEVAPSHGHDSIDGTGGGQEEVTYDHGSMAGMEHDHGGMPHHDDDLGEGTIHMHGHDMGGEVMKGFSPASPLWMALILVGAAFITLLVLHRRRKVSEKRRDYPRFNLLSIKPLKRVVMARPFQFVLQLPVVLFFIAIIITGLLGNQHPGSNLATVATWTIWWSLIIFIILFLGASWCLVCPWSALSDWLERLSFWKRKKGISLGHKWPRSLKSRHPMTAFFVVVTWLELGVFITYNPRFTAYFSIGIFILIFITALIFTKKSFCRYLCFVGGIIGIYSNLAPIEVRSKEKAVCDACRTKDCVRGNEKGYPCPIFEYPGGMNKNINCILCTECLKTCPPDNMTINLRPFFTDIFRGYRGRYDEAILALTLLGLTIYHGFTMLPLWFGWAITTMKTNYTLYIMTFTVLLIGFVVVPVALHYITAYFTRLLSGRKDMTLKTIFVHYAYALLPVALFYHAAHNISHLNMEGLKIFPVLSDPFGWGWNLFGTGGWEVSSVVQGGGITDLQFGVILLGLVTSIIISYRISLRLFGGERGRIMVTAPMIIAIIGYSYVSLITLILPMALRTVSYF